MRMNIDHPKKGKHIIELRLEERSGEITHVALQILWIDQWYDMIWFQSDGRTILKKGLPAGVPFDLDEDGRLIINRSA